MNQDVRRLSQLLIAVGGLCIAQAANAQAIGNIAGRVTDASSNQPIASAQIQVVGTTRGAVSNETGAYRIASIPAGTYTLRVLRIGFQSTTQTVTVTDGSTATADFAIPAVAVKLDEVVTTATGTTERKRETGNAIGTLQPSLAENANSVNVAQQLTGKIPGVDVASPGGTLGSSPRIRIRGASSVSLSNDPLVIVDGVRVNSAAGSFSTGFDVGGQRPSRLNDINPEDIDTYTVLKGPAAAALYGTAAAPGVIVITTKHGRTGAARWTLFGEGGHITDVTTYPANYAQIGTTTAGARTTGCTLDAQTRGACTPTPDSLVSFNPLVQASPFIQGHRGAYGASVQGGTEQTTYYVAGDYDREQGVIFTSQDQRANMRANLNAQLKNNWNLQIGTGYTADHLRFPQNDNDVLGVISGGILGSALCTGPVNGTITCPGGDTISHGYIAGQAPEAIYAINTKQDVQRFTNTATTTYQPLAWLTAIGSAGLDFVNRHDNETTPPNQVNFGSLPQGNRTSNPYDIYTYTANGGLTAVWNAMTNLRATTGVGAQFNKEMVRGTRAFGAVLLPGTLSLSGTSARFSVAEENTDNKTLGAYITEQLGYADRVFLNAALRSDNNSAFGQNFGFIKYPSVSGSWVINEERFYPKQNFVPSLRLRAAYGQSGQRPNFRDAITYFNAQTVAVGGTDVPGIIVGGTGNVNLRPERSKEFELGFDAGLLGNRANLEVTRYHKHTNDLLIAVPLPGSLGLTATQFQNLGSSENKGWEGQLTATVFESDPFKGDLTFTATSNDNKLLSLGKLPSGADVPPIVVNSIQQHRAGYPLGGYWARAISFNDANKDGIIARSEVTLTDTAVYLGNILPKHEWSIAPHVTIMRFLQVEALFDHKGGFKLFNNSRRFQCNFRNCQAAYDPSTPLTDQAAAIEAITGASDAGFVEKADFTKFRELTFTVGLPDRISNMFGGRTANIVLAGRNLHTWTKYTGFDPELNSTPDRNFSTSDFLTLPPDRIWTVRLNLSF